MSKSSWVRCLRKCKHLFVVITRLHTEKICGGKETDVIFDVYLELRVVP